MRTQRLRRQIPRCIPRSDLGERVRVTRKHCETFACRSRKLQQWPGLGTAGCCWQWTLGRGRRDCALCVRLWLAEGVGDTASVVWILLRPRQTAGHVGPWPSQRPHHGVASTTAALTNRSASAPACQRRRRTRVSERGKGRASVCCHLHCLFSLCPFSPHHLRLRLPVGGSVGQPNTTTQGRPRI